MGDGQAPRPRRRHPHPPVIALAGVAGTQVDPGTARDDVRDILSDRKFRSEPVPRPLRGPLEWLGDRVKWLAEAVADALRAIPGPTWVALAVLVAVLLGLLVARLAGRPGGRLLARSPSGGAPVAESDDPDALEAAAAEAEARGDYSTALRLRFRAGLLRLDERGAITFRPSLTTGEVRRLLGSATFDDLASTFEEVAYGGRSAEPVDVAGARDGWPRLLRDARSS